LGVHIGGGGRKAVTSEKHGEMTPKKKKGEIRRKPRDWKIWDQKKTLGGRNFSKRTNLKEANKWCTQLHSKKKFGGKEGRRALSKKKT